MSAVQDIGADLLSGRLSGSVETCGTCHHAYRYPEHTSCPYCAGRLKQDQTLLQRGLLGQPAGLGEQPSITDRDPGDENRVIVVDGRMPWQKQIDAQSADIATLESALREKDDMLAATYAELHEARRQIEMYRVALKELQAKAAMTVPEGSFY